MRSAQLLFFTALLFLVRVPCEAVAAPDITSTDLVVCSTDPQKNIVPVLSLDLTRVLYLADSGEIVRIFQGWGENSKDVLDHGNLTSMIKVQLPMRGPLSPPGWIAREQIRDRGLCALKSGLGRARSKSEQQEDWRDFAGDAWGGKQDAPSGPYDITNENDIEEEELEPEDPGAELAPDLLALYRGKLQEGARQGGESCCWFPLTRRSVSYRSGSARFGAARRGRIHAGADIFGNRGESIRAVDLGVVIRGPYPFYAGTNAVDVEHAKGFVARYGEVRQVATGVQVGELVRGGATIGYMGQINSKRRPPMLHFELYSGDASGLLTVRGRGRYSRRDDLRDPTASLDRWRLAGPLVSRVKMSAKTSAKDKRPH